MLEMMGQMMGKKPGEDQDSKSNQGGEGSTGESDSANTENKGVAKGERAQNDAFLELPANQGPLFHQNSKRHSTAITKPLKPKNKDPVPKRVNGLQSATAPEAVSPFLFSTRSAQPFPCEFCFQF